MGNFISDAVNELLTYKTPKSIVDFIIGNPPYNTTKIIPMQYLIITKLYPPFYTKWFDKENHFVDGMLVIDLFIGSYTTDGENWHTIQMDHL